MTLLERVMLLHWKRVEASDNARIAAQTPTPGIAEATDIAYLEDGHRGHLLDVYYPEHTASPLPVIIDIHGGGFMYGYKELNKLYNLYLASLGFTVFSLSYRLAPEARVPDQFRDINAGFHWIAAHGAQYPCDMNNVFVTGDSAGGLLSLHTALIERSPTLQREYGLTPSGLQIRALGLVSPATDLKSGIGRLLAKPSFGKGYQKQSYYPYLHCKNLPDLEQLPPTYLVTSEQDFVRSHTHLLAQVLKARGVTHMVRDWPKISERKLDHVFCVTHPTWPESKETSAEMTQWFLQHGALEQEAHHEKVSI